MCKLTIWKIHNAFENQISDITMDSRKDNAIFKKPCI